MGQAVEAVGQAVVDVVDPAVVGLAVAAEEAAVVVVNAALKGQSRLSRFVDVRALSKVDAGSVFLLWSLLVTRTDGWAGVTGRRLKFPWL